MQRITAYSDKIGVRPGETIRFMVNAPCQSYEASLLRIINGDTSPEGPGPRYETIKSTIDGHYDGREQRIYAGSYGTVEFPGDDLRDLSLSILCYVYPTTPGKGEQSIVSHWNEEESRGILLGLDDQGALCLTLGDGMRRERISTATPLLRKQWYLVAATYNAATAQVSLHQEPIKPIPVLAEAVSLTRAVEVSPQYSGVAPLMFAGAYGGRDGRRIRAEKFFNGKIEAPRVARVALERLGIETLLSESSFVDRQILGAWDFSRHISGDRLEDLSSYSRHGRAINLPTRAMTGHAYTGEVHCWRDAPEKWGAIHFHDDDLFDADWDVDFELVVPDLRSGVYAAKLVSGEMIDYVPFVVRPPKGQAQAKLAYLFPSATYVAYANEHFATNAEVVEVHINRATILNPHQIFLNEHREYGHSLYCQHSDGSGVCYSSRLRPILNMRPEVESIHGARPSNLWKFNSDTHILDWFEDKGFDYDVITDEDLHWEEENPLLVYQAVMTSNHPEYYSKQMIDRVREFTHSGGRLFYTGGNGFYWRIAYHPERREVIEVRRAEGGSRAWEPGTGEYYHSFTGEYGGLWRRQGEQVPNSLVGVGFAAQGFDRSTYYRRTEDSENPRAAFIFDRIEDEVLGDFGLIGGGASGMEIDRYDRDLGSPPHALVIASSENQSEAHVMVVEDMLFNFLGTGGDQNSNVRADMTFFELPGGGAVFSASSIAFSGALFHNGYDNNISRLTENVLRRFLDPTPFEMPKAAVSAKDE